jgi:hypothetical protein
MDPALEPTEVARSGSSILATIVRRAVAFWFLALVPAISFAIESAGSVNCAANSVESFDRADTLKKMVVTGNEGDRIRNCTMGWPCTDLQRIRSEQ